MAYRSRREAVLAAAEALAPLIAEHYSATGEDLTAAAADDRRLMSLAALYAELPSIAEEAGLLAANQHESADAEDERALTRSADSLLHETAEAIRHRLGVLSREVDPPEGG
jgi:hypothetical protein